MSASAIIADVRTLLTGEPVYLAGSLVACDTYGKGDAYHDVDLFCPTQQVLIATAQRLLGAGFQLDDRMSRTWYRWLRYGMKGWHTNSLRLTSPGGIEYNLVYKLTDGHPTTSLSQVLESFDFGLLATGYDLEREHDAQFHDLRPYLFPKEMAAYTSGEPLPMMPNKRGNWRNGFISQYNGIREFGRYVKYHRYGYDMSLVKDDLATGYRSAADYLWSTGDVDKQKMSAIYQKISDDIVADKIDELAKATSLIDYKDSLDQIMEALE